MTGENKFTIVTLTCWSCSIPLSSITIQHPATFHCSFFFTLEPGHNINEKFTTFHSPINGSICLSYRFTMLYLTQTFLIATCLWIYPALNMCNIHIPTRLTDTDRQLPSTPILPHAVGHLLPHQPKPLLAGKPDCRPSGSSDRNSSPILHQGQGRAGPNSWW